jgi:alpha-glucosidase
MAIIPDTEWWRGAVIYQVYPRSFFDSNGDGVGDLPGVTAKLDHIASLGVDAIWLCPFFTSPMKDFGYDVADHLAVDPLFGTLDDFDELVAHAHALGLRVLIDQVWSHTSDRHAWFLESRASRLGEKADWYVWADPRSDGTPPNNWLSVFGGSAWTWEPRRRQYYLHHFLAHQPALNLHNPEVVNAVLTGGAFWLDRGVDGFRLDAIDFMAHDPGLADNPPAPRTTGDVPAKLFGLQLHLHDMLHPATMDVLARIRALADARPGTAILGEVSSQDGAFQRVLRYTAGEQHLHMAYTLRPLRGGFDWPAVRELVLAASASNADGWPCWSFSNHDVERAISRWNPRRGEAEPDASFARLLMAFLLTLRGSVCLYQGEELGLTEAELRLEELRDPFGLAYWPEFRGRDGSRTPIPWDAESPNGGFTTADLPWLPVPESHRRLAVAEQERDDHSLLHGWRRLLTWRRAHPALRCGRLEPLDLPAPCIGFVRRLDNEAVLCLFNLSGAPVAIDLDLDAEIEPIGDAGVGAVRAARHTELPAYGVAFGRLARLGPAVERLDKRLLTVG